MIISSAKGTIPSSVDDMMLPNRNEELNIDETIGIPNNLSDESAKVSGGTEIVNTSKSKASDLKQTEGEEDLQGTVFISNLPFDIDNEEVKQRFSGFGEVQSFIPVLHRITKYAVFLTCYTYVSLQLCFNLLVLVAGAQEELVFSSSKREMQLLLQLQLRMLHLAWGFF